MKWLALLLLTPLAFGDNGHGHNHQSDTGASSLSGAGATSSSNAISQSDFNNFLYVDASQPAGVVGSDRSINIENGDYPANSAAALSLDYCVQGTSVQGREGGIAIGGSDPVCRQTRMIGAAIPEIMRLRAKDDPRALELDNLVTDTVFTMFDDEEDRRKADQSFNLFKAIGPWLLVLKFFL